MSILTTLVLFGLAATPPTFQQPIRLAVTQLSGARVEPAELELFAEHLALQLDGRGLQVVTAKQIASVLGFERQRQLLGCSTDGSSCIAELAAALGVDGLVNGEVARLGDGGWQLNLRVLDPTTAKALASFAARAPDAGGVIDALTFAAKKLAAELSAHMKRFLPPPSSEVARAEEEAGRPLRRVAWIPAAASAGFLASSGALYLFAWQRYDALRTAQGTLAGTEARQLLREGTQLQLWSAIAAGAAGLGLGTAAGLYLWRTEPDAARVALVPGPNGLSIVGVLP